MKNFILIFIFLFSCLSALFGQVISVQADVSSIFPSVFEEKTKVLKYIGPFSMIYFDSLDSTYLCEIRDFNYFNVTTSAFDKCPIPNNYKFSDMYTPDNFFNVWFGGKDVITGEGMYGHVSPSNLSLLSQTFTFLSLPDMNELKEIVIADLGTTPYNFKMFAIGTTQHAHNTHILELDVTSPSSPYNYATVNSYEYLDNLDIVEGHVVYATREINAGNVYVNLRVMDILNGLSNSSIDTKWRLQLPPNEYIYGNIFVKYLEANCFEVCYIKYSDLDGYVLCLHRIILSDMLAGINNTTISQEIPIERGEFIQDIVYDKVERTLILLMDKDLSRSVFLHTVPHMTINYPVVRLESAVNDRYFSIDTMASYNHNPGRMYQAWGGTKCFEQRFASGGSILGSCLPFRDKKAICVDPVRIDMIDDPLTRETGSRSFSCGSNLPELLPIQSNCFIDE